MYLAKSQDTKSIHRNHLHSFLYTNNEKSERKKILRNQSHSPLQQQQQQKQQIKYLGRSLPKDAKELYTENYQTLLK